MDFDELWSKIKTFFSDAVDYFKNYKRSSTYKFGDMIYAVVVFIIALFKNF